MFLDVDGIERAPSRPLPFGLNCVYCWNSANGLLWDLSQMSTAPRASRTKPMALHMNYHVLLKKNKQAFWAFREPFTRISSNPRVVECSSILVLLF